MLTVTWDVGVRGQPPFLKPDAANPAYRNAVDSLRIGDGVQRFPRSADVLPPLDPGVDAVLSNWLGEKKRVAVMVHGFMYDPKNAGGSGDCDPTRTVYGSPAFPPVPAGKVDYHNSWLPLVGEYDDELRPIADLALGFSWLSISDISVYGEAGWSNFYQYAVWDQAVLAAKGLAFLLETLAAKGVSVDILAHSLGTKVVSQAVARLKPEILGKALGKVVLLDGAQFCVDAFAAFAGQTFQVFNIVNREDVVLTVGASEMCHPVRYVGTDAARVIGRDGLVANRKWLDIQLDRESARTWLAQRGLPVTPDPDPGDVHSQAWMRHWVCYTNDRNRKLVAALLQDPAKTVEWFLDNGFPAGVGTESYGHFKPFVPKTPPDRPTRMATWSGGGWSINDYERYNGLSS